MGGSGGSSYLISQAASVQKAPARIWRQVCPGTTVQNAVSYTPPQSKQIRSSGTAMGGRGGYIGGDGEVGGTVDGLLLT